MTAPNRFALATYLTGSVDGLAPSAPVMLIGMRVGEVTAVELQADTDTGAPRVRVAFVVQPDRVAAVGGKPALRFPEGFRTLVDRGLRTSLKGGNLITGQKQLTLEIEADAPKAEAGQEGEVIVIPSSKSVWRRDRRLVRRGQPTARETREDAVRTDRPEPQR